MVTPQSKVPNKQSDKAAQGIGNPPSKRLYALKEAGVYLGRTEWGMRELIWSGQIPVIRNQGGRKIYIDVLDMDAFINRQKTRYM